MIYRAAAADPASCFVSSQSRQCAPAESCLRVHCTHTRPPRHASRRSFALGPMARRRGPRSAAPLPRARVCVESAGSAPPAPESESPQLSAGRAEMRPPQLRALACSPGPGVRVIPARSSAGRDDLFRTSPLIGLNPETDGSIDQLESRNELPARASQPAPPPPASARRRAPEPGPACPAPRHSGFMAAGRLPPAPGRSQRR